METPDEVTGPVNLGNPGEFTILQLAQEVIALTGSSAKVVHRPLPTDDPKQRCPDISLAQELLGWAPRVQLRDGLVKTIAYFEQLLREDAKVLA
jgi:UDP-glucuronate decarboxylase